MEELKVPEGLEQKLIGQTLFEARDDPRNTISHDLLPELKRVVAPGRLLSRDFRPDRVNIYTNDSGIVQDIKMG